MDIVKLYNSGLSISQIAHKLGISRTAVHKKLRKETQLRPSVNRKHHIDLTKITDYRTEECAYWMGYLAHKASFYKTRLTIRLSNRHMRHLVKLAVAIESPLLPSRTDDISRLSINSKELMQFYCDNGLLLFRSGDPTQIPKDEIDQRHFLRGVWDAKGIITHSSRYARIGYSTRHEKIAGFIIELLDNNNISSNNITMRGNRYYLWWHGGSAIQIIKFLYFNQTISLNSKLGKALSLLI